MVVFWVVVALFVAGTLLMLLPALWSPRGVADGAAGLNVAVHRDHLREAAADVEAGLLAPERLAQVRDEVRRRVLEDVAAPARRWQQAPSRAVALLVALTLPLATVGLYLGLGEPQAVAPQAPAVAAGHSLSREQVGQMVAALADRLQRQPDDIDGWRMLARSYTALGRYADGVAALRRVQALSPPDASLLADLADLVGMAQGKRLAGEPSRLIQQALDLDPRHVKALALAGSAAFEAKDYPQARRYWEQLLTGLPPESPMARSVQGSLMEARQLESGAGSAPDAPTASTATTGATASADAPPSAIRGRIEIAPELAQRIAPGATLFIFARAVEGPRMPLAIVRRPADGGDATFVLDDSSAMSPALKLSMHPRVTIGARVSASGNATPQPGDLVGQSEVVAPGATGVRVRIDKVQP